MTPYDILSQVVTQRRPFIGVKATVQNIIANLRLHAHCFVRLHTRASLEIQNTETGTTYLWFYCSVCGYCPNPLFPVDNEKNRA